MEHSPDRIRAQQLAMEARGAEGERKTITVLFADLKGSTALLEGLDPEVARAMIDPALQIMMDAVHRYEGYVAQALGDGILALFGAPLAHEDHAQRAIFAALGMQEDLRRHSDQLRLQYGAPLAMRVGINTGEVVVRSIRKDDLHTDYVPVGHSINLAARMEQMATPGSILITVHTQKLIEGYFLLKPLGQAVIKGVEQPLSVFEVTGIGQLRTRLQVAARRGLTRFVGRAQELTQIQQALALARQGHGQVIGIMGEPGMGKSRLVLEAKAQAQGFAVFEAYSASHGKASPYLPISELLKGYFGIELQDSDRARREKVVGKILSLDRNLEDVLPAYFALLNIEDPDSPLRQLDLQTRRRRTIEALKRATLRASIEQPLLLIYEDLHWIDSETQSFLDSLVDAIGSARIVLLTNYRPEYRHEWGTKTYCTQLRLAPLGREEAEEFLAALIGEPRDSRAASALNEVRRWILERTEGTPFFMEEVVQELFEQGLLARESEQVAVGSGEFADLQLPTTVQGVLAARIDRLGPDEKTLLQQLSVIGREFRFSLAAQVVDVSEDALHRLFLALQRKEFLYEQSAFPEMEYIFKHALTQEVAYNSLLLERRARIHERAAQAIEASNTQELEDHYGRLAYHYSRSGNVDKSILYLERAGRQAGNRAAVTDAVSYLSSALNFVRQTPPSTARARKELDLLLALIPPLHMNKGIASSEIEQICFQAHTLSKQVGSNDDLLLVLIELRSHYCMRGNAARALECAEELMTLAVTTKDPSIEIHARVSMHLTQFFRGDIVAGMVHATQVRLLYSLEAHQTHIVKYSYDPLALSLGIEAVGLWILGFPDQARVRAEEGILLARTIGHPHLIGMASVLALMHYALRREAEIIASNAPSLVALATENEFPDWLALGMFLSGLGHEMLGQREGLEDCTGSVAEMVAARTELFVSTMLTMMAEIHLQRGDKIATRRTIMEALAIAERNQEPISSAECQRILGDIAESDDMAEDYYLRAIALSQKQAAKSFELRATLSLAKLWMTQDRAADARDRLSGIHGWFTEGFDTPDLRDAKALLDAMI